MSRRFNLLFYLKKPKKYEEGGLMDVYMRVSVAGKRTEFSTQREWEPTKWNADAGRASGTKEAARELNAYLDTLKTKVYEAQRQILDDGEVISTDTIREIVTGKNRNSKKLLEVFDYHNKQMRELVNIDFAPGTMERYETARSHTKDFIKWKFGYEDIDVNKLNYEFVADMEFYFKTVRKCCHNTSIKYISNVKKIVNICVKNGWLDRDPFFGYKMCKKEVIREYLSEEEISAVLAKNFPAERLNIVRDIFIFSCYTGLAYADIEKLKRSEIIIGIDGDKWISTTRQKTDSASRIPLLPIALQILEKYKNHPKCVNEDLLLPIFSNQNMNGYLKEIAAIVGIEKKFTFHCARHTFATTVTLTNGVPIESVSKMLGHKNLKTTQHYAKIIDRKVSDDMKALKKKLTMKVTKSKQQKKTGT
ncbi:site-specific integrase [Chryseosolibacter indicus]|uniref:Site-specific integrase n=1 Tax=Chryseosolibacter indicus TaxID=2782351 RepID=A0ABS5VXI0_9BACT|nr:site-specific integrase [Chryseosolibacter indicus]MBT1705560.1 site-specific integrase [Chryseosolibacter indicus]